MSNAAPLFVTHFHDYSRNLRPVRSEDSSFSLSGLKSVMWEGFRVEVHHFSSTVSSCINTVTAQVSFAALPFLLIRMPLLAAEALAYSAVGQSIARLAKEIFGKLAVAIGVGLGFSLGGIVGFAVVLAWEIGALALAIYSAVNFSHQNVFTSPFLALDRFVTLGGEEQVNWMGVALTVSILAVSYFVLPRLIFGVTGTAFTGFGQIASGLEAAVRGQPGSGELISQGMKLLGRTCTVGMGQQMLLQHLWTRICHPLFTYALDTFATPWHKAAAPALATEVVTGCSRYVELAKSELQEPYLSHDAVVLEIDEVGRPLLPEGSNHWQACYATVLARLIIEDKDLRYIQYAGLGTDKELLERIRGYTLEDLVKIFMQKSGTLEGEPEYLNEQMQSDVERLWNRVKIGRDTRRSDSWVSRCTLFFHRGVYDQTVEIIREEFVQLVSESAPLASEIRKVAEEYVQIAESSLLEKEGVGADEKFVKKGFSLHKIFYVDEKISLAQGPLLIETPSPFTRSFAAMVLARWIIDGKKVEEIVPYLASWQEGDPISTKIERIRGYDFSTVARLLLHKIDDVRVEGLPEGVLSEERHFRMRGDVSWLYRQVTMPWQEHCARLLSRDIGQTPTRGDVFSAHYQKGLSFEEQRKLAKKVFTQLLTNPPLVDMVARAREPFLLAERKEELTVLCQRLARKVRAAPLQLPNGTQHNITRMLTPPGMQGGSFTEKIIARVAAITYHYTSLVSEIPFFAWVWKSRRSSLGI